MKIPATELRERLRSALRLLDDPQPGLMTWTDLLQGAMLEVRDAGNRWWESGVDGTDKLEASTSGDWTIDPATGRSNSSPEFLQLTEEVGRLIRGQAHALLAGDSEGVGRLVMAQLAHVHGLAPRRNS